MMMSVSKSMLLFRSRQQPLLSLPMRQFGVLEDMEAKLKA